MWLRCEFSSFHKKSIWSFFVYLCRTFIYFIVPAGCSFCAPLTLKRFNIRTDQQCFFFSDSSHFLSSIHYWSNSHPWCSPCLPISSQQRSSSYYSTISIIIREDGSSCSIWFRQSDWSAPLPSNERDYLCSCRKLNVCPVKSLSALRLYLLPLDAGFHTQTRVSYRPVMGKTGRSLRCWTISLCVLYLLIYNNYKENWTFLIGLMMCLYTVACGL